MEDGWRERIRSAVLFRHALPADTCQDIGDVGTWVSRGRVVPLGLDALPDVPGGRETSGVELITLPGLSPLKPVQETALHASGIHTRDARGWGPAGWSHSKPGRTVLP